MSNILQMEFFRLKKSKLFWALFGVCAGLPLLTALIYLGLAGIINAGVEEEISGIWEILRMTGITEASLSGQASLMGDTTLLAIICASIFLSRDFNNGTFRNMLLANKSRRDVYLSHLVMALTIGASYFAVSFVSTLIFDGAIFGFGVLNFAEAVTGCFVAFGMGLVSVIFVQTMMCMFLIGTQKLAVALACPIAICAFAPSFIVVFVEIFDVLNMVTTGEGTMTDLSWVPLYNTSMLDITNLS